MNELSGFKAPFQDFPDEARYLRDSSDEPLSTLASFGSRLTARVRGVTNGWSAIGGQTSSAYVFGGFEQGGNPMGSSSGSAVGLSAGWGTFAIGTDTTGSNVIFVRALHS